MAGSRLEKFGTIYKRVQGLLRSGALKEADKPIWFEVYQAFPPKDEPVYERPAPTREVPNMLYPEDIIRAQFYKTYGNPDVVNLNNERVKTSCQRFVDKYLELLQSGKSKNNLFEATATALRDEGVRLRTVEELEGGIGQSAESKAKGAAKTNHSRVSVASIFGEKTAKHRDAEEQDFIFEDDAGPSSKTKL